MFRHFSLISLSLFILFDIAAQSRLLQCSSRSCLQWRLVLQTFDRNPRIPPSAPVFLFMSSICSQLSPFLCCPPTPSSPTPRLSAISYFFSVLLFLKEYARSAITETPSFSTQASKYILVVVFFSLPPPPFPRLFILGFLEGRHICG